MVSRADTRLDECSRYICDICGHVYSCIEEAMSCELWCETMNNVEEVDCVD